VAVAADGSCWASTGASVMHIATDGHVLSQTDGFRFPLALSPAPDGGCWVTDSLQGVAVRLGADGKELWRKDGFPQSSGLSAEPISVNPMDGTAWLANPNQGMVFRLGTDGAVLATASVFFPLSVSLNPSDSTCWVAGGGDAYGYVAHLGLDGSQLWRGTSFTNPKWVSVDPSDGSCWVANLTDIAHLDASGGRCRRGRCRS
jgi:streptogramin lyase